MTNLEQDLFDGLSPQVGRICATSIVRQATARAHVDPTRFRPEQRPLLLSTLKSSLVSLVRDPRIRQRCVSFVDHLLSGSPDTASTAPTPTGSALEGSTLPIKEEFDILVARTRANEIIERVGFASTDRVRIVTVVSELARNIVHYAGEGTLAFTPLTGSPRGLQIKASDRGPGISNLALILSGGYTSRTGMGMGLLGTKRLMDEFAVDTGPGRGTVVTVRKYLR